MPDNPAKEAFDDLLGHLESLETRTAAMLQFLKESGIVTDEKLAPYLEQASKASDVRMRAARARMNHLFTADDKAKPTEAVSQGADKQKGQQAASQPTTRKKDGDANPEAPEQQKPTEPEPSETGSKDRTNKTVDTASKQKDAA